MWRELWWIMAQGRVAEYDELKHRNIFEFWKLYDLWKERTMKEKEARENSRRKR